MKYFFMNGGLGNQLYQYIFMRWMEIKGKDECMIDDSAFFGEGVPHNGYELERLFGLTPRLMSKSLSAELWQKMLMNKQIGVSIPQQILNAGNPLTVVYENGNVNFNGCLIYTNNVNKLLCNSNGNIYFHGYWICYDYLQEIEDIIHKEINFPEINDMNNKRYAGLITESESVSVHIRRGDMVALGWAYDASYFRKAINFIRERVRNADYFVFSDDLQWCKEHREELGLNSVHGAVTFIEGNRGEKAYIDLQLMTMCKHNIISRSSFSLLASMLNKNPDKIMVHG